jgi:hypothetical protein
MFTLVVVKVTKNLKEPLRQISNGSTALIKRMNLMLCDFVYNLISTLSISFKIHALYYNLAIRYLPIHTCVEVGGPLLPTSNLNATVYQKLCLPY